MRTVAAPGIRKLAVLTAVIACALAIPGRADAVVRITAADSLETALTYRVNQYRAAHGLRRLRVSLRLKTAATRHVANMGWYGYFSHSWSTGASFGTWIRWYWPGPGYRSWTAGENLFWAAPGATARQVVRAWINSPGHRANLLRAGWRWLGVGAVQATNARRLFSQYRSVAIVAAEFGRRS